jgi:hypothetical protein
MLGRPEPPHAQQAMKACYFMHYSIHCFPQGNRPALKGHQGHQMRGREHLSKTGSRMSGGSLWVFVLNMGWRKGVLVPCTPQHLDSNFCLLL